MGMVIFLPILSTADMEQCGEVMVFYFITPYGDRKMGQHWLK